MGEVFHGPRLKVERAKQHISDLHNQLVAFSNSDFYSIRVQIDEKTGQNILKFEIIKPIPEDTALIVGDAIHNLKSALDLAINEIIFTKRGLYDEFARFPVRDSRNELVAAVNGGKINQASKAVADFIVDVIKPYKGGNDALCSLHHLNILDKHRLLLPIIDAVAVVDFCARDDRSSIIMRNATIVFTRTRDNRIIAPIIQTPGNLQIQSYRKPTFSIYFDYGLPKQGELIVPTLTQFSQMVSGILDGLEAVFGADS